MLTSSLKVGSSVAYYQWSSYHLTEVTKVSPTGRITIANGMVFNAGGHQIKSKDYSYPNAYLVSASNAEEAIAKKKLQNEIAQKVALLHNNLQGKKNGYGNYSLNPEQVTLIDQLNESMTKPEQYSPEDN